MMDSYLQGSYLGVSGVVPEEPPTTAVLTNQNNAPALADEMIRLPGGIVLPKKTLLLIAIGVAALIYLAYRKKKG